MGAFDGKVVVITGAASFVGEAMGSILVAEGASVVLADRDAEHGDAVAKRLGDAARFVATDVSIAAELRAIATKLVRRASLASRS